MGTFEVTQGQYEAVMGINPSNNNSGNKTLLPVEQVSWNDIMADSTGFIARINNQFSGKLPTGYRFDLPTEAQWEYACRAGTATSLNNGKNITASDSSECFNLNEVAWYYNNSDNQSHEVGQKAPNNWGLYDMHGNLWERCKDMYDDYPTDAVTDPFCESGSHRVMRGGSYISNITYNCRSAERFNTDPDPSLGCNNWGFRLALVPIN